MALNAKNRKNVSKQAPVLEPGNYPARVVQVLDLGIQAQRPWKGEEKAPVQELMVTYELTGEFMPDEDGNPDPSMPRFISERFPLYPLASLKAKSTLRYKALDPGVQHNGEWGDLIGKPVLIALVQNKSASNGNIYNNVGGTTPPIKGMDLPDLVNPTKVFDLDDPDMVVYESLPGWIQKIVCENLEFQGSRLQAELAGEKTSYTEAPEPKLEEGDAGRDFDVPF